MPSGREVLPHRNKEAAFLSYYASKFDTVEINNTFYRMPKPDLLNGWAGKVPPGVRVRPQGVPAHHAPRQAREHRGQRRLFLEHRPASWRATRPRAVPAAPYLRKDSEKLKRFLGSLPTELRAVMEFRHRSWFAPETLEETLARCATMEPPSCSPTPTRRTRTTPDSSSRSRPPRTMATCACGAWVLRRGAAAREWMERIKAHAWKEVFVFFKHVVSRRPAHFEPTKLLRGQVRLRPQRRASFRTLPVATCANTPETACGLLRLMP